MLLRVTGNPNMNKESEGDLGGTYCMSNFVYYSETYNPEYLYNLTLFCLPKLLFLCNATSII